MPYKLMPYGKNDNFKKLSSSAQLVSLMKWIVSTDTEVSNYKVIRSSVVSYFLGLLLSLALKLLFKST